MLLLAQAAFSFSAAFAAAEAAPAVEASPAAGARQVIVLVVDALAVEDFTSPTWPNLRAVMARGGVIGLMNARTAGGTAQIAAHVTLGAGARARAGPTGGLAFDAGGMYRDRPAAETYRALSGLDPGTDQVLHLGLPELAARNADLPDRIVPGLLGQAVRDAGMQTAVIGNADLHDAFRRHGTLVAMDGSGRVGLGTIGRGTLADDPEWPFGWRTDYEAVWEAFLAAAPHAGLIVVDLGDVARLDAYSDLIAPERLRALRQQAIGRIDAFVGRLEAWARDGATEAFLMLVTPSPPAEALRRNFLLTPIAWAPLGSRPAAGLPGYPSAETIKPLGDGTNGPRLATSPTTRRAGIVTNTDVAPTVLAALGVDPPAAFTGRGLVGASLSALRRDLPWTVPMPRDPWEAVALIYRRATAVHALRPAVVRAFIGLAIAVFVGWTAWLAWAALARTPGPEARLEAWRWLLLLLLAAPLAVLLVPLLEPLLPAAAPAARLTVIGLLAVSLASVAWAAGRQDGIGPFAWLSLATVGALVADVILGAPLIKSSILGYDPITGARFYGIGNEYMGILIGTALVGTGGLLDRFPGRKGLRWLAVGVYAVVSFVLAAPGLGVNVGGTVAAVSGFGATVMLLWRGRLAWPAGRFAVATALAVAAVLAAAAWVDVAARAEPSHLGRAALMLARGQWEALWDIAVRKLQMNVRLLNWTIWAQVMVVSLGISAVALHRPGQLIRRLQSRHPHLVTSVRGAVVASLVALAVNDSGVVAAATSLIPATATLLYLVTADRGFPR
ncbi:MAG: hypothetical protein BAA04_06470 [Firmicutes bacterium ZCTH02-B6]|nr:MAG: hypothetical protein BAA04_06470 [Firmicutes bacterium ZCTH02-B6]